MCLFCYENVLLASAHLREEDKLTRVEHFEYLQFVGSLYDCSMENVIWLVGDNENRNPTFSRLVDPTFVACHHHIFDLAARDLIDYFHDIISKVHVLMKTSSFKILSAKL